MPRTISPPDGCTAAPVTPEQLAAFLARAQAVVNADYARFAGACDITTQMPPILSLEIGRRYARIIGEINNGQRSAEGFIDLTTGNILKADGWKGPALNFARGHILDSKGGTGRIRWTGVD